MFSGSKVARGKDWQWDDQDGGQGSEGEIIGYEDVPNDTSRNLVRVQWPDTGVCNSYRLGFHGYVDLTCIEEEVGPFYYRDHLPVLGNYHRFVFIPHLFLCVCGGGGARARARAYVCVRACMHAHACACLCMYVCG